MRLFDKPIAFNREFVELTGSINGALFLSQACYWSYRTTLEDKWFWKTHEQWEKETGLTRRELESARKSAYKYFNYELRGIPGKGFYQVKWDQIYEDLGIILADNVGGKRHTVMAENAKHSITENTTENTLKLSLKNESEGDNILDTNLDTNLEINPLIGFPLPAGWEFIDYGYDSDDSHNFKVVDQWGDTVSRSKMKQEREKYQNESKPKVAPKRSIQVNFEPYTGIWESYPDLKSTGIKSCPNPSAKNEMLPPIRRMTPDLISVVGKTVKKYPDIDTWQYAIKEYCKEIMNRIPDQKGYYLHRMSFFDFLNQKNGFAKFVNK